MKLSIPSNPITHDNFSMADLDEDREGFRIKDVDIFILGADHEATDGTFLLMTLLERCEASDDSLTLQGNVLEHCHIWQQVFRVKL